MGNPKTDCREEPKKRLKRDKPEPLAVPDLPKLRDVEKRLITFLKTTREQGRRIEIEAGRMTDEDRTYPYDLVDEDDMRRIKRRATRLLERMHTATGVYHLTDENRKQAA